MLQKYFAQHSIETSLFNFFRQNEIKFKTVTCVDWSGFGGKVKKNLALGWELDKATGNLKWHLIYGSEPLVTFYDRQRLVLLKLAFKTKNSFIAVA